MGTGRKDVLNQAALAGFNPCQARELIRSGKWRGSTAGVAHGYCQANLVVLPASAAGDFRSFCDRNPRPCPLIEVTAPGSPVPTQSAPGADLRFDVGTYRVYRNGALAEEVSDLTALWRDDFVAFLLGCSFTFEHALVRAGIPLRHVELARTVPMYRTNRLCEPAGPFRGPIVVSMRPIDRDLVGLAYSTTQPYTFAHGAPLHAGDAAALGIADLSRPDYGDSLPIGVHEVPVFWACGVTPQAAAEAARIEVMITHGPGHMFITDLGEEAAVGA
jgi:uncharacterized protein YcsI (UPF0317 family)